MKEVYVVIKDWTEDGDNQTKIHIFSTYRKAKKFYDKCLEDEMATGLSSDSFKANAVEICGEVYGEDEEKYPDKPYALEISISDNPEGSRYLCSWCWFEKEYYSGLHSEYRLERRIIDEDEI